MKQTATMILTFLFVVLATSTAVSEIRDAKLTDQLILMAGSDSVFITYNSDSGVFLPADFSTGDPIECYYESTAKNEGILRLRAAHDLLELRPVDYALWVAIITDTDTLMTRHVFMAQMQAHYVGLLREYSTFAGTISSETFDFTYADSSQTDLAQLRTDYRLDSIAGNGDELSQIANLLHWAHSTVRHYGESQVPPDYNVHDLLAGGWKEYQGVHCGVLASIMNEVFLATGYQARQVVCLPYDTMDTECHSINIVWSKQLGKWIYVDPTFEGMFKNAKGEPLSIAEVREAMASGDSLIVSTNLNWNGEPHSVDAYLRYMAKNLFRFKCFSQNSPHAEGQTGSVYSTCLDPTGYRGKADDTLSIYIIRHTDNAAAFWQKP